MFIDWTCVLDDGERPFGAEVDGDPRRPLRITAGDAVTIRVTLLTPAGAPFVLAAGESLTWTAKAIGTPSSRTLLARTASAVQLGSGRYVVTLTTAQTRVLPAGRAAHDLFAVRADGSRTVVVPLSELVIGRSSLGGA